MSLNWTDKYIPQKTIELVGQEKALASLKIFIGNYKKTKKKALLIHGPTGCGKTALVYALAKEQGAEVVELNASDFRTASDIDSIMGAASQQMSLFARTKIILIDELDGISGMKDRGGVSAIVKLLEKSAFPIVLIANDAYDEKLKALRKEAELVECDAIKPTDALIVLRKIADAEHVEVDDTVLTALARRCGGDMRGAITDLQTLGVSGAIAKEDLDILSDRSHEESIPNALVKVFKSTDVAMTRDAFDNIDADYKEVMLWIDHNLPQEYTKPQDRARAYDYLSRADIMDRRIKRWQHWRFLSYIYAFLSSGIAVSKDEKYKSFVQYKPTMRLLRHWQLNMKLQKRKAIAQKLATYTHCSTKDAFSHVAMLQSLAQNKKLDEKIIHELCLDEGEVEWLGRRELEESK